MVKNDFPDFHAHRLSPERQLRLLQDAVHVPPRQYLKIYNSKGGCNLDIIITNLRYYQGKKVHKIGCHFPKQHLVKYLFIGEVELNAPHEVIVQLVVLALVPRAVVVVGQGLEVAVEIHASSQGGIAPAKAPSKIYLKKFLVMLLCM